MLEHLSIFIENKPGKLNRISEILAQEKINIRAYMIAGAGTFGVLKVLVDKPGQAAQLLCARGLAVARKQIVIAILPDVPGALNKLLSSLSANGINVTDSYGFLLHSGKSAAVVIECDAKEKAISTIQEQGFDLLTDLEKLSV